MKFLTILVLVVFHRNWIDGNLLRDSFGIDAWFDLVARKVSGGIPMLFFSVLLPCLILFFISQEIRGWAFGIIWFVLSLAILVYCTEVVDLDVAFDNQSLWLRGLTSMDEGSDYITRHNNFVSDITYESFQSIIPSLFWFLLLGPAGALFYFLTHHYLDRLDDDESITGAMGRLLFWMEWLPARSAILVFAFIGEFNRTSAVFVDAIFNTSSAAVTPLTQAALTAVGHSSEETHSIESFIQKTGSELDELKYLLERSLWGWLGFAALLTILGL